MAELRPTRSIYLEGESGTSLGLFDEPTEPDPLRSAVLICPPWGWDEVASYRARRGWAQLLAQAGHPTLRLSLPASGDSGGEPAQAGLLGAWVGSIGGAAAWLAAGGAPRVTVLGLGLGGLLALEAAAAGAPIDEVALWATPRSGRRFVRETEAFSRLQVWHASEEGEALDAGLPAGWLEAGGFVLSAETTADLRSLDPDPAAASLRRALLLDRDGVAANEKLKQGLEAAGVEVALADGAGWGTMVSHPERSKLPLAAAQSLRAWLDQGTGPGDGSGSAEPPTAERLEIEVGGGRVEESTLSIEQDWGRPHLVLAEPAGERVPDLCAVFLNAGAVRAIGPSRIWVEAARRWAARGVPSVRLDLEGIGEADGEPSGALRVSDFYTPRYQAQLSAVLDDLVQRGLGTRFVLVGLCAGGYWAFRTAAADPRVVLGLQINAGALRWHTDLLAEREARKAGRALDSRWLRKLAAGEVSFAKLRRLGWALLVRAARAARGLFPGSAGRNRADLLRDGIEADLDSLRETGTRVVIAFSGSEPLGHEIESGGIAGQAERWPNAEFAGLPGEDHTLRPIAAQLAAKELLDRELEAQIRRSAAGDYSPAPDGRQR